MICHSCERVNLFSIDMRRFVYILFILVFACNSEDANDCFQTAGNIIQREVSVTSFNKILVNRDVELIISQADDYKVTIETGENLLNDVQVEVIGDRLELTDTNTCNFFREYGITKVYVEAPNIIEIRNSSQFEVSSQGILSYQNLGLFSEDFTSDVAFTVGDFRLSVNTQNLYIGSNNISSFFIDGSTEELFVGFFSGSGRFEGENLIAQNIEIDHRGSNDMILHPIQSLTGILRGTGNVIAVNQPPVVDVERIYTGQLIFD